MAQQALDTLLGKSDSAKKVYDEAQGWKAEAGARAAAGTEGAGVDTTFHDGLAIYQMTEAGLMANADISGTKYWKNKKLNAE